LSFVLYFLRLPFDMRSFLAVAKRISRKAAKNLIIPRFLAPLWPTFRTECVLQKTKCWKLFRGEHLGVTAWRAMPAWFHAPLRPQARLVRSKSIHKEHEINSRQCRDLPSTQTDLDITQQVLVRAGERLQLFVFLFYSYVQRRHRFLIIRNLRREHQSKKPPSGHVTDTQPIALLQENCRSLAPK